MTSPLRQQKTAMKESRTTLNGSVNKAKLFNITVAAIYCRPTGFAVCFFNTSDGRINTSASTDSELPYIVHN